MMNKKIINLLLNIGGLSFIRMIAISCTLTFGARPPLSVKTSFK